MEEKLASEEEVLAFLKKRVADDYVLWHMRRTLRLMRPQDKEHVGNIIQKFASYIPEELSKKEKAALLFDVLGRRSRYTKEENQRRFVFVSALIEGEAVCMGFSELYYILCKYLGIDCKIVLGYAWDDTIADGELHAWNQLNFPKTDSKGKTRDHWYHADLTWALGELICPQKHYFLRSDAYMHEKRHIWLAEDYAACPEDNREKIEFTDKGVDALCHILNQVIASELEATES